MKTIALGKREIKLIKSKRSKYMRLSISSYGEIRLSVPYNATLVHINNFLQDKGSWLDKAITGLKLATPLEINDDSGLSIAGENYSFIVYQDQPELKIQIDQSGQRIFIFNDGSSQAVVKELLRDKIRKLAGSIIAQRVEAYASIMGISYGRISIREQRSRWGSCSSMGNLNFNWKIVLAPTRIMDYVIVHELAHILEHNHSQNFWQLVEKYLPQYKPYRKWLRENSSQLDIV
jgi:hypothetical protein